MTEKNLYMETPEGFWHLTPFILPREKKMFEVSTPPIFMSIDGITYHLKKLSDEEKHDILNNRHWIAGPTIDDVSGPCEVCCER